MVDSTRTSVPAAYAERLWFGPTGWLCVVGLALVAAISLYPVGRTAAVVAGVLALAVGLAAASAAATRVRVAGGELVAGAAHIPLDLLGDPVALDAAATRAELGPRLDARAHLCLRAWARTAVRVPVLDPADPTPYWVVSTRHPDRLAAALVAGRRRPAAQDG
ncbi:DUF3093 domain-containing protein [Cellulomonas aerilata]|uniref:Membrane protein n=1 Tax=Cellulomonas aerilata TaxID=515326 RepID=A0A512DB28_9CELL|nr:DUF3093 domain-containing protein [Cellulomonas aerilata]GEO33683.1 membrane protein [Cellulomonas aerilata]